MLDSMTYGKDCVYGQLNLLLLYYIVMFHLTDTYVLCILYMLAHIVFLSRSLSI